MNIDFSSNASDTYCRMTSKHGMRRKKQKQSCELINMNYVLLQRKAKRKKIKEEEKKGGITAF